MKLNLPASVGVPEIAPSVTVSPGGRSPVDVHVYVPLPPATVTVASNGALTSLSAFRASVNGSLPTIVRGSRTTIVSPFVSLRVSAVTFADTTKS